MLVTDLFQQNHACQNKLTLRLLLNTEGLVSAMSIKSNANFGSFCKTNRTTVSSSLWYKLELAKTIKALPNYLWSFEAPKKNAITISVVGSWSRGVTGQITASCIHMEV